VGGVAGQAKIANICRAVKGKFGHPLPLTCGKITLCVSSSGAPGFGDVADRGLIIRVRLGIALIVALAAGTLGPAAAGTREVPGSGPAGATAIKDG
jgi:hypothetical protein